MTGDNSVWQLGINQPNLLYSAKPLVVPSLTNVPMKQIVCSTLGSFTAGLSLRNEVYVWGHYQQSSQAMYPIVIDMPPDVRAIREVRASKNLIAALDKNQRLFVWSATGDDNTLGLKEIPRAVAALKKHRLRHVFLGDSYIFAMGDNIGEPPRQAETRKEYSNMLEKSGERRRHRESLFENKRLLPKSVSIDSQLSMPESNDENINF